MRAKYLNLIWVGVILVAASVFAGASVLEGVVKDATGRPIKGAEVRIETKKNSEILKTDSSGHYATNDLPAGTYKVTLVINGQVKAVILDAETQLDKPTQLNFDLSRKGALASVKKHTQRIWIPSGVDTRIRSGHWVEVDDNGNVVDSSGFNNVEKVKRPAVYGKDIMDIRVSPPH